jgi:hypothetical protein
MAPAELQFLIGVGGVVIFVGLFLAILFAALVGVGIARLLYIGGRWCMEKIHQSHTVADARTMHTVGRMVPHQPS